MSLLSTIDEFKQHVVLNASAEADYFDQLRPDLLLAEDEHLRGTLGTFYDAFVAQLGGPLTAEQARLRDLLRGALANLAMLSYLDVAQVQISGSGILIVSTEREKTAFQWQIHDLKRSYARKGFNALDKALAWLEAQPLAFAAWHGSATARAQRAHFLTTAAEFSAYYNISNARLTFLALAAVLRKTEAFALEPVLGTPYFDELQAQLRDEALTDENRYVVERFLRPALAHLTLAAAVPELGFGLNGAALELNVYRFDDANSREADPGLGQLLQAKVDQARHDGERFLRRLRAHLNAEASATRYATYFASGAYEPVAEPAYLRNQPTDRSFLAF